MALSDHVKPLKKHTSGLRTEVRMFLMYGLQNKKGLDLALKLYEGILKQIETYEHVADAKCPEEREEKAAEHWAHLIVDAAFIHFCIQRVDYPIGKFPYDYLVDKLYPPEEKPEEENKEGVVVAG